MTLSQLTVISERLSKLGQRSPWIEQRINPNLSLWYYSLFIFF